MLHLLVNIFWGTVYTMWSIGAFGVCIIGIKEMRSE